MRPAWAERGAPNVLSGRGPGALEAITAQAARLGLKIVETAVVTKDGADVTFARCEPVHTPDITQAIADTTDKITALRVVTTMQREGKLPPLIEIKGLGAVVADAKKGIASVRAETAGLSTDAAALVAAVQDVRTQIKQAHDDLKFEAETLGNGSGSASATSDGAVAS